MSAQKQSIASIQAIRFFAAMLVVIDHCLFSMRGVGIYSGGLSVDGRFGVDIFFVISGFIMVYISSGGGLWTTTPKSFVANRVARIVPAYYLATASFVALFVASDLFNGRPFSLLWGWDKILKTVLFIPYFETKYNLTEPILGQGWTLNFEMFFYLIFACALAFPRKFGFWILAVVFGLLVAAGQVWNAVAAQPFVLSHVAQVDAGTYYALPRFWLHPIILEFLAGAGLAFLRERLIARGGKLPQPNFWFVVPPLVLAGVFATNCLSDDNPWLPLVYGVVAIVIVSLATLTNMRVGDGVVDRFVLRMGDASYSLYLFHYHVLFVLVVLAKRLPAGMESMPVVFTGVGVGLSLVAAWVSYRMFELPVAKWLRLKMKL